MFHTVHRQLSFFLSFLGCGFSWAGVRSRGRKRDQRRRHAFQEAERTVCNSRLRLHERHAGGLVAVGVDGRHHLAADRVEDGQGGERPGDLAVLRHAPQLLAGLLDGAVVHQLDAGQGGGGEACTLKTNPQTRVNIRHSCGERSARWLHAQKK